MIDENTPLNRKIKACYGIWWFFILMWALLLCIPYYIGFAMMWLSLRITMGKEEAEFFYEERF